MRTLWETLWGAGVAVEGVDQDSGGDAFKTQHSKTQNITLRKTQRKYNSAIK